MTAPEGEAPSVSDSGIVLEPVYPAGPSTPPLPGSYPFTRGLRPEGYRQRVWTMRQYTGFGSARATNRRFHYLLDQGETGLSTAFDLPTQMGYDSDAPEAKGEVGRVGVPIDTLDDMELLLDRIPLDRVTTSMTINAPASLLLLLYELVAERRGIPADRLGGTIQNDVLKEYAARGTYILPPRPSLRLITDTFAYCRERLPRWNPISISGYHIREAGATATQEVGLALADGIAYVEAARAAGLTVDDLGPRLSFFFNVGNDFFEEVAKFRAARQLWAELMRDRFGATSARSQQLRVHAQTGGATLTAQQPLNNTVRVAIQALAAVLGGVQSLHTNGYDEALALPSEQAATIALRTQQILAHESGVARVADPLGGSHLIETLTQRLAADAAALIAEVDRRGGAVAAIEAGFYQQVIQDSAYQAQRAQERGERVVVGVNRFRDDGDAPPVPILRIDPELEREQAASLRAVRARRDPQRVAASLEHVRAAARGSANLLWPMRHALQAEASLGEVCGVLVEVFGRYRPSAGI
ncbi:MAG TPA: methylmalonyl-CoA mutase family protein [Verrucomicrobiae bacterium]|nr:methylmalonyl-CoA mutase family protein [Verrucomicrobiae bacterium]